MPLRCKSGDRVLRAYELDADEWKSLKEHYRTLQLNMMCCGNRGAPRTSKLGTQHFYHLRRGECTSASESATHLAAKSAVAQAAIEAGWDAECEVRGSEVDGGDWIADVLAHRNGIKVAIEVQLAGQTAEETKARHEKYRESGVRCLWLMRRLPKSLSSLRLPAFQLVELDPPGTFVVKTEQQGFFPLEHFIVKALSGDLGWMPRQVDEQIPCRIISMLTNCWRCGLPIRCVEDLVMDVGNRFAGAPHISYGLPQYGHSQQVLSGLNQGELDGHRLCVVGRRYSKSARRRYLANSCPKCEALQGKYFLYRKSMAWHESDDVADQAVYVAESEFSLSLRQLARLVREPVEEVLSTGFMDQQWYLRTEFEPVSEWDLPGKKKRRSCCVENRTEEHENSSASHL